MESTERLKEINKKIIELQMEQEKEIRKLMSTIPQLTDSKQLNEIIQAIRESDRLKCNPHTCTYHQKPISYIPS